MNRLIFEGRLLVNIVGSVIRQDDLRPLHGQLDWERMYRIADYHKIANISYLGMLGNGERISKRWQERFFERYQEALLFDDLCVNAEKEILMLLDMSEVSCIILASCGIRNQYQLSETAASSPLKLYLDSESYVWAKGYLVDLGYETERSCAGCGERMKRVSGFCVELYHTLPFKTRLYQRQGVRLLEHAYIRSSYQSVRTLSLEDQFILRVAEAAYHYATDALLIRELLDIHLFFVSWCDQMNEEYIKRKLKDFNINELGMKLIQLARMWFGTKQDAVFGTLPEDMSAYDVLENRILSQGVLKKETDPQALFVVRQIELEENKEKRKKRMERIPVLLPFFGIRRGIRMLLGLVRDSSKSS
ncbi:MAG: nucleotidyltransferase family protein [Lachnospiraceae bacterium]